VLQGIYTRKYNIRRGLELVILDDTEEAKKELKDPKRRAGETAC
jgi:hypothetical protein